MRETSRAGLFLTLSAVATFAAAQSSAGYRLTEHALNSGGAPDGSTPSSASYRLSLAAIGEIASGSAGFPSGYPAPREVAHLSFESATTLRWDPDLSAGTYNLYRESLGSLAGLGYGSCLQPGLTAASATDSDLPATGGGWFYLVTVESRLREEGSKGFDGQGVERAGNACP